MSYLLFLALQWLSREMKGLRLVNHNGLVSNPFMLIMLHLGGIVLFGILPYVSGHSSIILINYPSPGSLAVWTTLQWMTVLIIVSPMMAKTKFRDLCCPFPKNQSVHSLIHCDC